METLWQDVKYGARMLARQPGFTAVAVLTLALGIGANTAIFSVVNAVLLQPLPYPEADRIVRLEEQHERFGPANLTGATFLDVRERNRVFAHLTAFRYFPYNLTGDAEPESVVGVRATEGFFAALGVRALYGRTFQPEEYVAGGSQAVVLSYDLWHRRYGDSLDIIGRTIALDAEPYRVVGVTPAGFRFPDYADLWLPMTRERALPQNRRAHLFFTLGRLKQGVSFAQAAAALGAVARQIEKENPNVDPGLHFVATPLQERMVAPVRTALLVLLGAVGFLLLIACANVANLLLARAVGRQREFAIRAAMGAGRLRLARQLVTESILLALAGGALGVLLAVWSKDFFLLLAPGDIPQLESVGIDWRVLSFAAGLSLLTGAVFGVSPALHATGLDLQPALKESGRTATTRAHGRLRSGLLVAEVAITLVLLVGAGLLGRSFLRLVSVDPGYNPENVLTMFISLPDQKYPEASQKLNFYRQLLERIHELPGVVSAAVTNSVPTGGLPSTTFEIEGRPNIPGEWEPSADVVAISPGGLRTLEIPLLRGRLFAENEPPQGPAAVLVNETLARRYWPKEDPLGKRITMLNWNTPLPGVVVGVVGDIKLRGLDEPVEPTLFYSDAQFGDRVLGMYLLVRTTGDPLELAGAVRDQLWAVDGNQPVADLISLEQRLSRSLGRERFNLVLLAVFAGVALVLALVGIYGVVSYAVNQRTHEIGVRLALGAQRGHIFRQVVGEGMALAAAGLFLGLAGAIALTRVLASLLFEISPTDPLTFVAVGMLLIAVVLLACYVPARRATRVDPMVALRYE